MTPDRIKGLRRLCDAATPGPWDNEKCEWVYAKVPRGRPNGEMIAQALGGPSGKNLTREQCIQNAAFIAAARTAMPELLDEVSRLRGLLRLAAEALEQSYDAQEWPGDGTSKQEEMAAQIRQDL